MKYLLSIAVALILSVTGATQVGAGKPIRENDRHPKYHDCEWQLERGHIINASCLLTGTDPVRVGDGNWAVRR